MIKIWKSRYYYEIADYARYRLVTINRNSRWLHELDGRQLTEKTMRSAKQVAAGNNSVPSCFLEILVMTGKTKQQVLDMLENVV